MKTKYIWLFMGLLQISFADVLHIEPYAQWTFDKPLEEVVFRTNSSGFPIMYTLDGNQITYYDSLGNDLITIHRTAGDEFILSEDHSHFMLLQQNESNYSEEPQRLYSYQVYDFQGNPKYTFVRGVQLSEGNLEATLTNQGSLIVTEDGQPWVLEMAGEDTLLYIAGAVPQLEINCEPKLVVAQLANLNEFITASSCPANGLADSAAMIDLHLWNNNKLLADPVEVPGKLVGLEGLTGTNYYFLEIYDGYESTLTLFNRDQVIGHFPWKTWNIDLLNNSTAFVISENDLNVVNLGDGTLVTSYHPIDLSTISDATYLPEWGLFMYIRYEPFFTEDGIQAFRNFELEAVSKTGQIAHRSSFGSWTTTLPKLSQIGKDLFAIHMFNAVLMYRVELEEK